MNPIVLGLYLLAALAIVLGFIALLAQRVYIDRETNTPVEVSLPILGKVKSNYPALILFLAGVSMALYAFNEAHETPVEWTILGSLKLPENLDDLSPELRDKLRSIDWQDGYLDVLPTVVDGQKIEADGSFALTLDIEQGETPEGKLTVIRYHHDDLVSTKIKPQKEYASRESDAPTLLKEARPKFREYDVVANPRLPFLPREDKQ